MFRHPSCDRRYSLLRDSSSLRVEHLLDGSLVIEERPFAQCGPAVVERTPALGLADLSERYIVPSVDEVNQPLDVYYMRERSGECDFIVSNGNKVIQCIQLSYDISNEKTRKREINGLLLAHKQTKCSNLLMLTGHIYEEIDIVGLHIIVKPVYEWCTEE